MMPNNSSPHHGFEPGHLTGSTGPIKNPQAAAPTMTTAEQTAKAQKKEPVLSTAKPAMAGVATPAKSARQFCNPVQFPAASGPAMVCGIAHWLDANIP